MATTILLYVQIEGEIEVLSETGKVRIGAGWLDDFSMMLLTIKCGHAPQSLLTPAFHCLALPSKSGGATLIYRSMEGLFAAAEDLTTFEAVAAVKGLLASAAATFQAAVARNNLRPVTRLHLARACAVIARSIGDPLLDAEHIALELGLCGPRFTGCFNQLAVWSQPCGASGSTQL